MIYPDAIFERIKTLASTKGVLQALGLKMFSFGTLFHIPTPEEGFAKWLPGCMVGLETIDYGPMIADNTMGPQEQTYNITFIYLRRYEPNELVARKNYQQASEFCKLFEHEDWNDRMRGNVMIAKRAYVKSASITQFDFNPAEIASMRADLPLSNLTTCVVRAVITMAAMRGTQ